MSDGFSTPAHLDADSTQPTLGVTVPVDVQIPAWLVGRPLGEILRATVDSPRTSSPRR